MVTACTQPVLFICDHNENIIISFQAAILGASILIAIVNNIATTLLNAGVECFDEIKNVTEILAVYPFPSSIPFLGAKKQSPAYELTFAFQVVSILFFGMSLWSVDTIIVGLMMHIKAQFEILANYVSKFTERAEITTFGVIFARFCCSYKNFIFQFSERNVRHLKTHNRFMRNIKICLHQFVIRHQEIIELVTIMEELFSFLMLVQFSWSLLSICACLYQISLVNTANVREFSDFFIYFFSS